MRSYREDHCVAAWPAVEVGDQSPDPGPHVVSVSAEQ